MPRPLPVIANTFRCALEWSALGQTATNVIHIRAADGSGTAASAAEALDDAMAANMFAVQTTSAAIVNYHITPLDGTSASADFAPANPANVTGLVSGQFIPQSANLIKLLTATRGRSHRGRVFLPFVSEGGQDSGSIGATNAANLTAAWTTFFNALASDTPLQWNLVVASYKLATAADVTSVLGEAETGTQRRRQTRNR